MKGDGEKERDKKLKRRMDGWEKEQNIKEKRRKKREEKIDTRDSGIKDGEKKSRRCKKVVEEKGENR